MSKQYIIGVSVLVIVGIVFVVSGKKDIPADKTMVTDSNVSGDTRSLKGLLEERTPVTCTFSGTASDMEIYGTVYVGNGKIRGDYETKAPTNERTLRTYMIMDDTSMRYWTDMSTQGFKSALDPNTLEPTRPSNEMTQINQEFSYNCSPWVVDISMFVPPSTIRFTDLDAPLTVQPGNTLTTSKSDQCAACDLIPDTSGKSQCRIALQCN